MTSRHITDDLIKALTGLNQVKCWQLGEGENTSRQLSVLLPSEKSQQALDILQAHLGDDDHTQIVILSPEAVIPKIEEKPDAEKSKEDEDVPAKKNTLIHAVSTDEIHHNVEEGAKLTANFLLLTLLSTIVASIGIIENRIPILIGAMLIAPLLGPNLSLAFGSAMGDFKLIFGSLKVLLIGLCLSIVFSFVVGRLLYLVFDVSTLTLSTKVGYDSIILAFASGAAGVLSLISGVSGMLVGVMVAVALLPPTVVVGIALSLNRFSLAGHALLLLAINVVCINLSANLLFWFKGIRPVLWREKHLAKKTLLWVMLIWSVMLAVLALAIFLWLT